MAFDLGAIDPAELSEKINELLSGGGQGRAPAAAVARAASRVEPHKIDSGIKESGTETDQEKLVKQIHALMFPPAAVMNDVLDSVGQSPEIKAERDALEKSRSLLAAQAANAPGNDPTSALSYLANYYTKGQAKYIEPAKSPKQTLMEYALKLNDDQKDLVKNVSDLVGKFRGGYTQDQSSKQTGNTFNIKTGEFPKAAGGGDPAKNWFKWSNQTKSVIVKMAAAEEPLIQLEQMINSGNPTAEREIPITLTKAIVGSARIAQQEIALGKGDPGLVPAFEQGIQKLFHGGEGESLLTPDNRAQYTAFLKLLREAHAGIMDSNKYAAIVSAEQAGINVVAAQQYYDGLSGKHRETPGAAPAAPAPAAPLKKRTPEQEALYQELLKKSKSKN